MAKNLPIALVLALVVAKQQFVLGAHPFARSTIAKPRADDVNYRLPESIIPLRYIVSLDPDFDTDTFIGSTTIELQAVEDTDTITLHAYQLTINDSTIEVIDANNNNIGVSGTSTSEISAQQFYIIHLDSSLQAGEYYTLTFGWFEGILNSDMSGFYLAKYTDEDGNERKLGVTQFEATSARRAFPCFDEPHLKATFVISLTRPADYTSVSNTPLVNSTELSNGKYLDLFEETVPISTYLVAFVVSDFDYTDTLLNQRVLARPVEIAHGTADYALVQATKILAVIEDFTGVNYTLKKMDQVAVPEGYFSAGAMENWGLVTYREMYLLYYNESTTVSYIEFINSIISHEYGHQWFGNLVSPLWWRYIWLNEGFATYFEFYATSVVQPTWEMMDQYVIRVMQNAMISDGTTFTRDMNQDAGSPSEISSLFDNIAYDKAGSVIRMMETFLTTDVFRSGLNKYLNKMAFGAAQPSDLYSSLQEAVDENSIDLDGLNVSAIMTTWDSTAGIPLINVERNYEDGSITLTQNRYIENSASYSSDDLWYVPITYAARTNFDFANTNTDFWLTTKSSSRPLSLAASDWLILNKQARGYYRINYDETNWNLIIDYLHSDDYGNIPITNRAQLIDDAFTLAKTGRVSYSILLSLLDYLSRETHYVPLYPFFNNIEYLRRIVASSSVYSSFQNHILTMLRNVYDKLTVNELDDDTHCDRRLRSSVIRWMCSMGSAECRESSLALLRSWRENSVNPMTVNTEQQVICGALRIGNSDDWNFAYERYVNAEYPLQKTRFFSGLACSEDTDIITNFLDLAVDTTSEIESSSRLTAFTNVYSSGNVGLEVCFDYIKNNLEKIAGSLSISSILYGIASYLNTEEQLAELVTLKSTYPAYSSAIDYAIAIVQENIERANTYLPTINEYYTDSPTTGGASLFRRTSTSSYVLLAGFLCTILLKPILLS